MQSALKKDDQAGTYYNVLPFKEFSGQANTVLGRSYTSEGSGGPSYPEHSSHLNTMEPKRMPRDAESIGASTMADPTREEFYAKLEATEARVEASITRLETQMSKLPTASVIRGNVWGAAGVVVATVIGIFSLWAVGFDSGIQITTTSVQDAIGARDAAQKNAAQIDSLNKKVDTLLDALVRNQKEK